MKRIYLMSIILSLIALSLLSCSGDAATRQVKNGDTIEVSYTGMLQDGKVFDTSVGRDPLEFTVGQKEVIEGFDQAVLGMKMGEKKVVKIPAAQAYPYRKELVFTILRKDLKAGLDPAVGMKLNSVDQNGNPFSAVITKIDGDSVTVDANSPLAGKDLTFEIQLLSIK